MVQATANQHVLQTDDEVPEETRRSRFAQAARWVVRTIPTLLVLAALMGVGFAGHRSGWKVPKFSALIGHQVAEEEAWCLEHNVAEGVCVECLPALMPLGEDFGWCKHHGVHQCTYCHPEIAQLATVPAIDPQRLERAQTALTIRDRKENTSSCTLYRRRVQFASNDAVRKAGIDVEPVETRPITESIAANGEITYDETRVAHLSSRVPGTVWRVEKSVGDRVRVGEILALVDSAEVGQAKSELLQALAESDFQQATYDRLKPLADKEVVSKTRLLEVESTLEQAKIRVRRAQQSLVNMGLSIAVHELQPLSDQQRSERLQFLGIADEVQLQLASSVATNNLLPIYASLDGLITQRHVVPGEVVGTERTLFALADTSRMWLTLDVPLEDASDVAVGQTVDFKPDGSHKPVVGNVTWISTDVDRDTRTVAVRADLENRGGDLRNETFGSGRIVLREEPEAIAVPSGTVHWDGTCFVVFVRNKDYFKSESSPKVFHTRTVRPGVTNNASTEILAGLLPGEVVVTAGSGVLRSQVLKNNLGAGCTCGH
jgi:multidrug efflux pump subunit AcrA (membrane-fusion protein)